MPGKDRREADEARIDQLVAEYVERINDGSVLKRNELVAQHPDVAEEVLARLEAFVRIEPQEGDTDSVGILGDYTLRRQIGRGGMGVVYEAWERAIGRTVALKVLPAGIAADPRAASRFLREAQAAGRLHHPNIVSVHAMGVYEKTPYYSMEFVEGKTLSEILGRVRAARGKEEERTVLESVTRVLSAGKPGEETLSRLSARWRAEESEDDGGRGIIESLSRRLDGSDSRSPRPLSVGSSTATPRSSLGTDARELLYYGNLARAFAEVAEALQHAHTNGVIHRDIKPSNLIVDEAGRLRILDFGLAQLEGQESLTVTGDFLGTPLYMSPEQAMARRVRVDHRTDVYSLGATLYEMLLWHPPFRGKDHRDTLSQIIFRDAPPPRRQDPHIPRDLETIVLKCLRKNPQDRYSTAEALSQDLRRFVAGEPIEARPQPAWERVGRRAWRHRWRFAVAGVMLVLLLTTGLLYFSHWRQTSEVALREKEALYRDMVLGAITKIELRRFGGSRRERDGQEEDSRLAAEPREVLSDPVEEARADLEEAAALFPERPDALYHLARIRLLLNAEDEARATLAWVLERAPDFVPALILEAHLLESKGREKEARATRERAKEIRGEWAEEWLRSYQARQARDWSEAERAYGRLIALEREGPSRHVGLSLAIRLWRGRVRLEAKEFAAALEDFARVSALWPNLVEPVLLLGKAYYHLGERERAEEIFKELGRSSRPRSPPDEVFHEVSRIYYGLGEYEKALAWVDQAAPSSQREDRRQIYLRHLGRLEEALAAGERALKLDPENASAHVNLGVLFSDQGKPREAMARYRRAVELDPKNVMAHGNLGSAYLRQFQLEEAAAEFQQAKELDPDPAFHNTLGELFKWQGELGAAIAEYRKALELDPRLSAARLNLGDVLRQRGHYPEAIATYRGGIEVDPGLAKYYVRLEDILDQSGLEAELGPLVETLEEAIRSEQDLPSQIFVLLAYALVRESAVRDPERALEFARLVVERGEGLEVDRLTFLAEIQFLSGERRDAVRTLERAVGLAEANLHHSLLLEDYRRELHPELASYASMGAVVAGPELEVLIPRGAEWRYFPGRKEPSRGLEWTRREFKDAGWEKGRSGFGYGSPRDLATPRWDMEGSYTTFYIRHRFSVSAPNRFRRLRLLVYVNDGFVAYLNGAEVGRVNAGETGIPIPFDARADGASKERIPFELWIDAGGIQPGENCLAVQGLNQMLGYGAFYLHPILQAEIFPGEDRKLLADLRARARGEDARSRLAYLEGRILQREGDHREAIEKFTEVLAVDRSETDPFLHLWESLRKVHGRETALALFRMQLQKGRPNRVIPIPPGRPQNVGPVADSFCPGPSVRLEAELVSHPDPRCEPVSARWEVREAEANYDLNPTLLLVSEESLKTLNLPAGVLLPGRAYFWRVSYTWSDGLPSTSSDETPFTTGEFELTAVRFNLSEYFDQDVIADPGDDFNNFFDEWGYGQFLVEGFDGLRENNPDVRGLPGDGVIGVHRLGDYRDRNALRLSEEGNGAVTIEVPRGRYVCVRFLVASSNGDSRIPVTFKYLDGSGSRGSIPCDDWFDDLEDHDEHVHEMDLQKGSTAVWNGMDRIYNSQLQESADAALFEVILPVQSEKELTALILHPSGGDFSHRFFNPRAGELLSSFSSPRTVSYLFAVTGMQFGRVGRGTTKTPQEGDPDARE